MLEKFKQADGHYKDERGFDYASATDLIMSRFEFCGCGTPVEVLEYIRGSMQLLRDLVNKVWKKKETYDSWAERCKKHFGSDGAEYFMWYWLDKMDYTTHGGSVPGWLEPEGEILLDMLNEWAALSEEEKDQLF